MQRHPVAQVTPYLLATPLLATLMGIIFLGDVVGPRLWLGGAMVLGGCWRSGCATSPRRARCHPPRRYSAGRRPAPPQIFPVGIRAEITGGGG